MQMNCIQQELPGDESECGLRGRMPLHHTSKQVGKVATHQPPTQHEHGPCSVP